MEPSGVVRHVSGDDAEVDDVVLVGYDEMEFNEICYLSI